MATTRLTVASTAASADVSSAAWTKIPIEPMDGNFANHATGPQIIKLTGQSTANFAFVVGVAVVNAPNEGMTATQSDYNATSGAIGITEYYEFTFTPQTRRSNMANSAGNYVCTVTGGQNNDNKYDLLNLGDERDTNGNQLSRREVYVGLVSTSGTTTAIIDVTIGSII